MLTDADLKGITGPSAEDKAKGDPGGTITGTVSDIVLSDPKKGLTLPDLVNMVGQNQIAINFVWTLITGFLVMFMQAGFAIVETGLTRAKNANHTMMMNFMVYGVGMLAYWLIGFAIQEGGVGAVSNLGGTAPLSSEFAITVFGKSWGLFGQNGIMLGGATYDVGVMVMFLFQMVFMDTALTIVTGTAAERWKYSAFIASSFVMGAFTYPLFGNWAWGGGWLATLGSSYGLGHGYSDFAGSGVVITFASTASESGWGASGFDCGTPQRRTMSRLEFSETVISAADDFVDRISKNLSRKVIRRGKQGITTGVRS